MTEIDEVPWSVAWSAEQGYRIIPSRDFTGYLEVDQRQARGEGEPLFALIHASRQRRAMIDMLCHVCGEPTQRSDRYLFPAASGGMVTLHDGSQQFGCNVPTMHLGCAERAAAACPHLTKVDDFILKCGSDDGRLIPRTDVLPGMEEIAKLAPQGAKVIYACYRLYGPAFTEEILDARERWAQISREKRAQRRGEPL